MHAFLPASDAQADYFRFALFAILQFFRFELSRFNFGYSKIRLINTDDNSVLGLIC